MELLIRCNLIIHISCGALALLAGLLAMLAKKGGRLHRKSGMVFFYAMLGITVTAVIMAVIRNKEFLLLIGIFSFYQNYNGYRAIRNKSLRPSAADLAVWAIASVNTFFMLASGAVVLLAFGIISALLIFADLRTLVKIVRKQEIPQGLWLRRHIGHMVGAYIATLTAFLVVNIDSFQPAWVIWLLPTALLTPLIFRWTRKYVPARPANGSFEKLV